MSNKLVFIILTVVAFLLLLRVFSQWRRFSRRRNADWDEQFILQLRKAGVNTFEEHLVDFFFTLPDAAASTALRQMLVFEGFTCVGEHANPDGGYSLDLQKRMRLIVPEMQALTVRFTALAEERGGKYDNWAVGRRREG